MLKMTHVTWTWDNGYAKHKSTANFTVT